MSEPPSLLLNQNHSGNHWLSVKLVGVQSNRSALGARITLSAGGRRQVREVMGASSYLSQNDLRQHFGLGRSGKVDAIEVRWPSGLMQRYANLEADQFITLREGDGKIHKARY
jgi:hypothetical protein